MLEKYNNSYVQLVQYVQSAGLQKMFRKQNFALRILLTLISILAEEVTMVRLLILAEECFIVKLNAAR